MTGEQINKLMTSSPEVLRAGLGPELFSRVRSGLRIARSIYHGIDRERYDALEPEWRERFDLLLDQAARANDADDVPLLKALLAGAFSLVDVAEFEARLSTSAGEAPALHPLAIERKTNPNE